MVSSVFSHGLQSLAKLAQVWWPRPASSIGYRLPLVPTVLVDNRGAMQAATEHLIVKHERRKILFVRGRGDSQEATDRYFGFRQALREHQIINDVGRVLQGDFTRESVLGALSVLPAETEFDALIASNDEMALAAASELERRGVRIPDDVSVIGFDDIPAARRARVALTTMAQPFDALASTAIKHVIEQCEGGTVPAVSEVPVNFVRRASCGCGSRRPERRESLTRSQD
jgi:LacI family transcriptional regulator